MHDSSYLSGDYFQMTIVWMHEGDAIDRENCAENGFRCDIVIWPHCCWIVWCVKCESNMATIRPLEERLFTISLNTIFVCGRSTIFFSLQCSKYFLRNSPKMRQSNFHAINQIHIHIFCWKYDGLSRMRDAVFRPSWFTIIHICSFVGTMKRFFTMWRLDVHQERKKEKVLCY